MKKGRTLKPEETRLWHKIARSTKPISKIRMNELELKVREIDKVAQESAPKEAPKITPAPHSPKSRKIVNSTIQDAAAHKRVRRGNLEIAAKIDLHGFNQDEARTRLHAFIHEAYQNQFRYVLVITGKGAKNADNQKHFDFFASPRGIIRMRFKDWLHDPQIRHLISGVATANPKHGGAGAFYVLLKA